MSRICYTRKKRDNEFGNFRSDKYNSAEKHTFFFYNQEHNNFIAT